MKVNRLSALKAYEIRTDHHASRLKESYYPLLQVIEAIADRVEYHLATLHFWIGDVEYYIRGRSEIKRYDSYELVNKRTDQVTPIEVFK